MSKLVIYIDYSRAGLELVLGEIKEIKEVTVCFNSRKITSAEKRLPAIEGEGLCLCLVVNMFKAEVLSTQEYVIYIQYIGYQLLERKCVEGTSWS